MNNLFYDYETKMPCYLTTKNDLNQAEEIFENNFQQSNILNRDTVYDRKESRIAGILGEIVFKNLYGSATASKNITYDFQCDNLNVDVKCKLRNVKPKLNFEASFFAYQSTKHFDAEVYYFMSTILPMNKVWLCGFASKKDIMNHAETILWKAGDIDRRNNMEFKRDTVCIPYKYLTKVDINNLTIWR